MDLLKKNIPLSKSEDWTGFIKQVMNPAASYVVTRRVLPMNTMEGLYRQKDVGRELLAQGKKGLFLGETGRGFLKQIPLHVWIRKFQNDWFKIPL